MGSDGEKAHVMSRASLILKHFTMCIVNRISQTVFAV